MYNNDRKQEFIEKEAELRKLENVEKRYVWAFRRVEPYENKYNKDVSEFSYDEIMEMYKDISITLLGMEKLHGALKNYATDIVGDNNKFILITTTALKSYFNTSKKTLISYEDIIRLTDDLLNAMDKFFIYGLFCGIRGINYCELNYSTMEYSDEADNMIWLAAIDENNSVVLKGRKFLADEKLFSFAKDASNATHMLQYTKNGVYKKVLLELSSKKIYKLPYTPVEHIPSLESEQTRINQRLKNIINNAGLGGLITPLDIYWSGIIYSMQKKAIQKSMILKEVKDYIDLYESDGIEDIQYQYNIELNKRTLKNRLERYL